MTDNAASGDVTAPVESGVSDAEFNEYFSSRGEKAPFKEEVSVPQDETVQIEEPKLDKKTKAVKGEQELAEKPPKEEEPKSKNDDADNNYKRMAHEERQKRQEIKQELENQRRELEQMRQFLQEQHYRQQQPEPPSFEENPLDALRYEQQVLQQKLQQQEQYRQQLEYEKKLSRGEQEFKRDYRDKLLSFGKENDVDIEGVYKYLTEYKQKEYLARGLSPEEAKQELIKEELSVVARAYNQGINPGQLIYNVAQALGYQRANQSQSAQVEPSVELLSQANEKLANIEKGIAASRTLGSSNANPPNSLTLSQIANLPPDEFAKYTNDPKNWEAINRKLAAR